MHANQPYDICKTTLFPRFSSPAKVTSVGNSNRSCPHRTWMTLSNLKYSALPMTEPLTCWSPALGFISNPKFIALNGNRSRISLAVARDKRSTALLAMRKRKRSFLCTGSHMQDSADESFKELESYIRDYLANCENPGTSPLTYENLRLAGRIDLISRIMDSGGYIEVANRLGFPVDKNCFIPPSPVVMPGGKSLSAQEEEDNKPFLAVGRLKEDRLNVKVEPISKEKRLAKLELRSSVKKEYKTADDIVSAKALSEIKEERTSIEKPIPEGELLILDGRMRACLFAVVVSSALGYGRASKVVLSDNFIHIFQGMAVGLFVGHFVLAVYAAIFLAPKRNRSLLLWWTKILLAGPAGILALVRLGPLDVSQDSPGQK